MVYDNVLAYCKEKGLSIAGFEKLCGIGNGVIAAWKEENAPTTKTLIKMEKATGIPAGKWLSRWEEK